MAEQIARTNRLIAAFNEAGNLKKIGIHSNEQFAAAIDDMQRHNDKFFAAAWRAHRAIARGE